MQWGRYITLTLSFLKMLYGLLGKMLPFAGLVSLFIPFITEAGWHLQVERSRIYEKRKKIRR